MVDENTIVRARQHAIRREMDRRGISLTAVQYDGGWKHQSTVASYFPLEDGKAEPATMSVAALYRLLARKALPADLLSLLLPDGYAIVRVPDGIDHDKVEDACRDYLEAKGAAHHIDSPAKRDISDCEDDKLNQKVVSIRAAVAA